MTFADVCRKTEFNQWRNRTTVNDWVKNLSDKHKRNFIKFDMAEFYPSISENLLNKSIDPLNTLNLLQKLRT